MADDAPLVAVDQGGEGVDLAGQHSRHVAPVFLGGADHAPWLLTCVILYGGLHIGGQRHPDGA